MFEVDSCSDDYLHIPAAVITGGVHCAGGQWNVTGRENLSHFDLICPHPPTDRPSHPSLSLSLCDGQDSLSPGHGEVPP